VIGSLLRRYSFYTLDAIKGRKIKKHYREIKNVFNMGDVNNNQLKSLIKHTIGTVPYYKEYDEKFTSFPVLTKNVYKENYDLFQSKVHLGTELHQMSTSGSTGTPFIVKQDINKRNRTIADLIFFNEIEGQRLGDKYIYLKTWAKKKSSLENFKQNVIPVDILKLDDMTLKELRMILKTDKKIKSALGYASSYEVLAKYLSDNGDTSNMFNIKTLFSSSSILTDETKSTLESTLGCSVIDRYSNQENGILAQTNKNDNTFYVNRASYYIELLKINSDENADIGELGRIVITDLYNFAMPFIRYDTGDLAISDDIERNNLKTLRNIQGRRVDIIFDTQGNMMTPHTWGVNMRKYSKLKQWQFIQEGKREYILKVNGAKDIYTNEDFDKTLRDILGQDANIKIIFVDEIPVLSSGKFKNTICNYDPFIKK